jgi:hypothetical protein
MFFLLPPRKKNEKIPQKGELKNKQFRVKICSKNFLPLIFSFKYFL